LLNFHDCESFSFNYPIICKTACCHFQGGGNDDQETFDWTKCLNTWVGLDELSTGLNYALDLCTLWWFVWEKIVISWVDHDSLLVHLLSILAVASMSFICGCTLFVILFATHYLYMYESMMRDLQIKNFKTWEIYLFYFAAMYESLFLLQCICNVFHEMYLQHSKTGTYPKQVSAVSAPSNTYFWSLANRTADDWSRE